MYLQRVSSRVDYLTEGQARLACHTDNDDDDDEGCAATDTPELQRHARIIDGPTYSQCSCRTGATAGLVRVEIHPIAFRLAVGDRLRVVVAAADANFGDPPGMRRPKRLELVVADTRLELPVLRGQRLVLTL